MYFCCNRELKHKVVFPMTLFPGWKLKVGKESNSEFEVWAYYLNHFPILYELQISPFMAFKYVRDSRIFYKPSPNGLIYTQDFSEGDIMSWFWLQLCNFQAKNHKTATTVD